MSRIYENLFFKFDYKTHSDTNAIELQENCTFLKRCCCEISSFASQYNYNDVQANGYFSLLAVVVNFDKILSKEITKQRPKLKKYIIISRCLRLMFEILLEFRDSMDKSTPGNEKYLLASHHEVGFKGFTYTQTQLQELSVIFGTIGPFWLYKSFQKVIQQIAVGIALLQPFPKSLVVIRNRRSRSLKYAKSAISGKTFKLLNLCDTKLYSIYINLHYWRSCVKSVTKFVALDRVIEIHNDNLTLNLKQNDVKKRIRFRYLFNCQKLEERKDLLIHIHGGCFVKSSPDAHEIYLKDWAFKLSNVPIIAVDYTKAKFPAGLQDVVDLYLWLTTNSDVSSELGFKPNRIVLSGDSAGANIAVAVSLVLNDANKSFPSVNITFPAGILSVYGAFKVLPLMSPSRLLSGIDPMLYQTLMLNSLYYYSGANEYEVIDKQICSKKQQKLWFQRDDEEIKQVFTTITNALSNAYASPLLYSSFNEMPSIPLSLISCHFCPLLDDTIELAKIWKGIVKLHVFDGLPHGFLNFLPKSIEVQTASDECVNHVKQFLCNSNQ